jgi:tRNA threonylcarbamoyladenosine biosynthesis protein TsaE
LKIDFTASLGELDRVYDFLESHLPIHAMIFLRGDLAAGKTTLTSFIAKQKGLGGVSSPTFALQNIYGNTLFHYDLYRIEDSAFMQMGLFEEFEKEGWHLIEWGSNDLQHFLTQAGYDITTIDITPHNNKRLYTIQREGHA